MVLLDPIIQILVGAIFHAVVQFGSDRTRIAIVTIGGDTRRDDAGLAQSDIDERTETINGAIKVTPAAAHFHVVSSTYQLLPIRPVRRRRRLSMRVGVSFASQSRTAS